MELGKTGVRPLADVLPRVREHLDDALRHDPDLASHRPHVGRSTIRTAIPEARAADRSGTKNALTKTRSYREGQPSGGEG